MRARRVPGGVRALERTTACGRRCGGGEKGDGPRRGRKPAAAKLFAGQERLASWFFSDMAGDTFWRQARHAVQERIQRLEWKEREGGPDGPRAGTGSQAQAQHPPERTGAHGAGSERWLEPLRGREGPLAGLAVRTE
ncbi:hypothetical protein [Cohnella fermenti]|uniref:Uncharacterized protein n=1 Tax=Cohnella fermenti TaxID=2565925 RepID=A0A4S4C713_9BACL|nr:hypothetical protein [Cohnella fermenti]THF83728.1 hypothetical protein E6C55_03295 [Cohnella fermenti]